MTATQHALLLPEIRCSIIAWVWEGLDDLGNISDEKREREIHTRQYTLLCCGLVNRTWYHDAMPLLWKDLHPSFYWHNLPKHFRSITPDRRQFYANFVEKALLDAVKDENDENDEILQGLAFPKLRSLHLFVDYHDGYIPRIQAHRIEELDVVPRHHAYPIRMVDAEVMSAILEQIPVSFRTPARLPRIHQLIEDKVVFPDVRNLVFVDCAPVYRGAPQRLAARLPRLEKYDHRYLGEVRER
ncbi:uncharacterized protein CDV56_106462 [Aspergillus thermomutatus]|uniref:F-box domain-containing protein n=1 Tax=Aspergillus thermomutatus TaxID=41047 RepID=A0A397H0D9_ASPTH|nr:uncharacterized protein CDV56_106462 [Aspergillus thermomutatus]RHZ56595.1 hypothetical protein CDV56_106462 [Aspergillus thermomutatus]